MNGFRQCLSDQNSVFEVMAARSRGELHPLEKQAA
jgi:hypothetical protein